MYVQLRIYCSVQDVLVKKILCIPGCLKEEMFVAKKISEHSVHRVYNLVATKQYHNYFCRFLQWMFYFINLD